MGASLANAAVPRHRLLPESADAMAKADLRKAETEQESKAKVGRMVSRCRMLAGLSLKEFAALLRRDERQVSRWESGDERVQVDAVLRVELLRGPWIQAQAETIGGVTVKTTIEFEQERTA